MATTGGGKKGGKKKKGQTVPLTAFLADSGYQAPAKKLNWAEESDDTHGTVELAEEYGGPPMDLRNLPSAPRSSRSVDLDMSRLPSKPPYTAFLGNLPFDVTEDDIRGLFKDLRVENIRFPQEAGRVKGFGYAEFFDIEQLKSALALSNEKIRSRQIRIDIADQAGKDQMSRDNRGGGGGFDDKTSGDWRTDDGSNNDSRQDDRRRDDRRGGDYGDREPRSAGPADMDDCWRKDDGPTSTPSSNTWGNDRGGRGRDDSWGGRRDGGGFRDDRGGRSRDGWGGGGGYRDDRGGGYRDDRGGGFRDDRGGGGFRDDRGGGGFRDDRGGGFRDDRGGGFRDDRGGGFRDDRGGGFRDDRGGGFRDDRGGGFRDDRGGGFRDRPRDDRGGGYRDDRGGGRGGRDDRSGEERPDDGPRSDEPVERRKLNLKPRTVEPKVEDATETSTPSPAKSSIFGNAKPVDTATKERLIEEKLNSMHINGDAKRNDDRDFRGRRDDDRSRERSRDGGRGRSRDGLKEGNRDGRRERSREQEYSRDGPRARSSDASRGSNQEDPRGDVRDSGHEGPRDYDNRSADRDRLPSYEDDRDRPRDRERPPGDGYSSSDRDNYTRNGDSRSEFRDNAGGDGEPVNWRDESLRHDKPRVMRPDLVTELAKDEITERTINIPNDDMSLLTKPGREDSDNRSPGKSPKGKKWKDGPVVPPKYEEPPQPVFSQASRFAALGLSDEEVGSSGDEIAFDEEQKPVETY